MSDMVYAFIGLLFAVLLFQGDPDLWDVVVQFKDDFITENYQNTPTPEEQTE